MPATSRATPMKSSGHEGIQFEGVTSVTSREAGFGFFIVMVPIIGSGGFGLVEVFVGWADAEAGVLIEGELLRQRGAEPLAAASALEPGGALELSAVEGWDGADAVPGIAGRVGFEDILELFLEGFHPAEGEGFQLEARVEIDDGDLEEGIVDVAIGNQCDAILAGIGPDGDAVG